MFQSVYNALTLVSLALGLFGSVGTICTFLRSRRKISIESINVSYRDVAENRYACLAELQVVNQSSLAITVTDVEATFSGVSLSCEKISSVVPECFSRTSARTTQFPIQLQSYGGDHVFLYWNIPQGIPVRPDALLPLTLSTSRGRVKINSPRRQISNQNRDARRHQEK